MLGTIRYFRDEYEAHIRDKRCPAGACEKLRRYVIEENECKGCSKCARSCPANAIRGEIKKPYFIEQENCVKCGACVDQCAFHAIKEVW